MDEDILADYWQIIFAGDCTSHVSKADARLVEEAIRNGTKLLTVSDIYGAEVVIVVDRVVALVNWTREIGARYKQAHADCKTYDSDD